MNCPPSSGLEDESVRLTTVGRAASRSVARRRRRKRPFREEDAGNRRTKPQQPDKSQHERKRARVNRRRALQSGHHINASKFCRGPPPSPEQKHLISSSYADGDGNGLSSAPFPVFPPYSMTQIPAFVSLQVWPQDTIHKIPIFQALKTASDVICGLDNANRAAHQLSRVSSDSIVRHRYCVSR